jgi:hypothetical protein
VALKNTQLDGTIQLPDGRTIPVVVSVDLAEIEKSGRGDPDPLLLRAVEVFGKSDKALSWLNTPNPAFGNRSPRDLAMDPEERDRVFGVLSDLEHGFPA